MTQSRKLSVCLVRAGMAHTLALEVMERERAGPQKGLVSVQGDTAAGLGKPGEENHLCSSSLNCKHHLLLF